jgi:periplasmic copper chaperone A
MRAAPRSTYKFNRFCDVRNFMKPKHSLTIAANFVVAVLLATTAFAQPASPKPPTVFDIWVKTTPPGGTVSGAYMHIKSATAVKLVKASTPAAGLVEIHEMKMNDGIMEMRALDALDIPADQLIDLKPSGKHIMLMQVKAPIKQGDKVPLTLTFEDASKRAIVVNVMAIAQEKDVSHHRH